MGSITEVGRVIDIGSLYEQFQGLRDKQNRRGQRYSLALILVLTLLAKL